MLGCVRTAYAARSIRSAEREPCVRSKLVTCGRHTSLVKSRLPNLSHPVSSIIISTGNCGVLPDRAVYVAYARQGYNLIARLVWILGLELVTSNGNNKDNDRGRPLDSITGTVIVLTILFLHRTGNRTA